MGFSLPTFTFIDEEMSRKMKVSLFNDLTVEFLMDIAKTQWGITDRTYIIITSKRNTVYTGNVVIGSNIKANSNVILAKSSYNPFADLNL
ncbi:hypothetical protein BX661DRAFT_185344 [Kickxella alabastrina]|uniref:uncharacterized protein n=1 Tax=Kickxella alabastrina TaxID=61397 RepID=UPI002220C700|nr:uncharacterized protein BX661DRAFT_185344 [Kickxella alabastrina]KAI7824449.1 hypothetical protein BX661DRAFT_185344 [Kickxella alabastrina]